MTGRQAVTTMALVTGLAAAMVIAFAPRSERVAIGHAADVDGVRQAPARDSPPWRLYCRWG